MILLIAMDTYYNFRFFSMRDEEGKNRVCGRQLVCMFMLHFLANILIWLNTESVTMLAFYGAQVVFFLLYIYLTRLFYRNSSRLLVNNMCTLLATGFIILTRLNPDRAMRQFVIVAAAAVITWIIPFIIDRVWQLVTFPWVYGILGLVLLGVVCVIGNTSYGAQLSLSFGGFTVQPSEFVKISFVFFVAAMFYQSTDRETIIKTTVVAALHVLVLVLSKDLGSALIFFVAYMTMLFVATSSYLWFGAGIAGGSLAAVAAYYLFPHVRRRVEAWADPWSDIANKGYQVAQALFAIGTGGWFGMGLYQGMPDKIPLGSSDFVFASISEELGGAFAVCIVLVCFSCFLMFLNIAMQIKDQFYKLIALGLGCVYGVQVFLNVGGVIKFIPSTGLTLPLVSYGGSSILCTIIMFAIIQGLYIMRQDEEGESNEQKSRGRKQKRDYSKKKVSNVRSQQKPKIKSGQTGHRSHESGSGRPRGGASSRFDEDEIEEIW